MKKGNTVYPTSKLDSTYKMSTAGNHVSDPKSSQGPSTKSRHKRRKVKESTEATNEIPRFANIPTNPRPLPERSQSTNQVKATNTAVNASSTTNDLVPDILPPSLSHLQTRYAFATMSIVSGSKITQKVRSLLVHLEKFSFADVKAKPGVVVLHSKASVASKMVSVVEIVKREVEKQGGRLYQYSRVDGRLEELKEKKKKEQPQGLSSGEGRTLAEGKAGQVTEAEEEPKSAENDGIVAKDTQEEGEGEEEEEEAFETMIEKGGKEKAGVQDGKPRKRVRAIPVMTIYLSRVTVSELKQLYG